MSVDLAFIRAFLNRPGVEGPQQLRGYIPCFRSDGRTRNYTGQGKPGDYRAMGASGVTIATGVDLGQTDAPTLEGWGLDSGLARQLVPYLELRRDAAIARLHAAPLHVSRDAANALDAAVHGGYLRLVIRRYDADAGAGAFADLPPQAQAVIFSLCFQRGCAGGPRSAPLTWAALTRRDWATAAERLCRRSLWRDYQNRRALEGALLREALPC